MRLCVDCLQEQFSNVNIHFSSAISVVKKPSPFSKQTGASPYKGVYKHCNKKKTSYASTNRTSHDEPSSFSLPKFQSLIDFYQLPINLPSHRHLLFRQALGFRDQGHCQGNPRRCQCLWQQPGRKTRSAPVLLPCMPCVTGGDRISKKRSVGGSKLVCNVAPPPSPSPSIAPRFCLAPPPSSLPALSLSLALSRPLPYLSPAAITALPADKEVTSRPFLETGAPSSVAGW